MLISDREKNLNCEKCKARKAYELYRGITFTPQTCKYVCLENGVNLDKLKRR